MISRGTTVVNKKTSHP